MADPFTLAALGIGTAASLGKGIYDAATLDDRKKKWKREQEKNLRRDLTVDYMNMLAIPDEVRAPWMMGMKNKFGRDEINRAAEENFQLDPFTFVPFVQQGTALAGGIYDAAQPSGPIANDERALDRALAEAEGGVSRSSFDDRRSYLSDPSYNLRWRR